MLNIFSSAKKTDNKKLSFAIKNLFQKKARVDDQTLEQLEEILIMADFGVKTTTELITNLKKHKFPEEGFSDKAVRNFLSFQIKEILLPFEKDFDFHEKKLQILTFNGVNGSGKTTTIGKIAHKLNKIRANILNNIYLLHVVFFKSFATTN